MLPILLIVFFHEVGLDANKLVIEFCHPACEHVKSEYYQEI